MRQLNVFLNLGVQKLKIAIRGRVLLCMFFCVVNLDVGKFGPYPVGGYGYQGG